MDSCRVAFDRWATAQGPARLELVGPLMPIVAGPPPSPGPVRRRLTPFVSLLCQVADGQVSLEGGVWLDPAVAPRLARAVGLPSGWEDEASARLEVEELLLLARRLGITKPDGDHEVLLPLSSDDVVRPSRLWMYIANDMGRGRPGSISGDIWELCLAWLLRPDPAQEPFENAVAETLDYFQVDPSIRDQAVCDTWEPLRALCRGLQMFDARCRKTAKPILNGFGRAAVRLALMTIAYEFLPTPKAL